MSDTVEAVRQETAETGSGGGSDDELSHYYCCNPDIALCGADISDSDDYTDMPLFADELQCIVCEQITVCALCNTMSCGCTPS